MIFKPPTAGARYRFRLSARARIPGRNACAVSGWAPLSVPGFHQGEELAAVRRRGCVRAVCEPAVDLGHGPVVVGRYRAVVQAGVAQGRIDELVAEDRLHRQRRRAGIKEQCRAGVKKSVGVGIGACPFRVSQTDLRTRLTLPIDPPRKSFSECPCYGCPF